MKTQRLEAVPSGVIRRRRYFKVSLPCGRGKKRHVHRTSDSTVIMTYVKYGRVCNPKIEIVI